MIKMLLEYLIHCFTHVYTFRIHQRMIRMCNSIYTMWISNYIGEVGPNTRFIKPLLLQGLGLQKIHIGSRNIFSSHCILGCWEKYGDSQRFEPEITIGDDCNFGEYCQITAINKITIGNGLLTGRFVYIGDNSHGGLSWDEAEIPPSQRHLISKGEIKIGNNVWIGDKASIMGGVTIGDNVIIGAGSIITHDIPSNSLVAGVPAKILKQLKE